jgi:hypothetical protein
MAVKIIAGAMAGVAIPIVIEYAVKGEDISAQIPVKWSGVIGIALGAVDIALVYTMPRLKFASEGTKGALLAFGAASLAEGIMILVLEQLRKQTSYTFQTPVGWIAPEVPMVNPYRQMMAQQYTSPVGQIVKEI